MQFATEPAYRACLLEPEKTTLELAVEWCPGLLANPTWVMRAPVEMVHQAVARVSISRAWLPITTLATLQFAVRNRREENVMAWEILGEATSLLNVRYKRD